MKRVSLIVVLSFVLSLYVSAAFAEDAIKVGVILP